MYILTVLNVAKLRFCEFVPYQPLVLFFSFCWFDSCQMLVCVCVLLFCIFCISLITSEDNFFICLTLLVSYLNCLFIAYTSFSNRLSFFHWFVRNVCVCFEYCYFVKWYFDNWIPFKLYHGQKMVYMILDLVFFMILFCLVDFYLSDIIFCLVS